MKKITTFFIGIALSLGSIDGTSQVNRYDFTSSSGTFSEITDGTVYKYPTNLNNIFNRTAEIGFDFIYNGKVYNNMKVSAQGFVSIGNHPVYSISPSTSLSNSSHFNIISPMSADIEGYLNFNYTSTSGSNVINVTKGRISDFAIGDVVTGPGIPYGTTITAKSSSSLTLNNSVTTTHTTSQLGFVMNASVIIKTTGTAPNRKCIVQWKNFSRYMSTYATPSSITRDKFTFQLILSEGTNNIEFVYNSTVPDNTLGMTVGMKGMSDSDYATRTGNWTSTTAGGLLALMHTYASSFPTSGYTFKYTPPYCFTPPTELTSTISTSTGNPTVSWTPPITGSPSSGYAYRLSTSSTPPNFSTEATGTIPAGTTSITLSTLSSDSVYYFWVRGRCSSSDNGPWSDGISIIKDYCSPNISEAPPSAYYLSRVRTTNATELDLDKSTTLSTGGIGLFLNSDSLVTAAGSTINISVELSYYYNGYRRAYIDLNNNNEFEASESVFSLSSPYSTLQPFTIPYNTAPGVYRMRAIYSYGSAITNPCNITVGEVEDYKVVITAPDLNCVEAVAPIASTSLCATDTPTLKWRKAKYAENYSVYFKEADSETFSLLTTTTDTTYHFTSEKAYGTYKWYVIPNYPIYGSPEACDTFTFDINNSNLISDYDESSSQYQSSSQLLDYISSNCKSIATIYSLAGVLGNVETQSILSPTARIINDVPLLRRHFEINADNNSIPAYVTLYISKDDIINFNENNLSYNDIDTITGANMIVKIYHDPITIDGAGPDGHDTINIETITPIVMYDDVNERYNISFLSSGFSGFYITSSIHSDPLSADWSSLMIQSNASFDKLNWKTYSNNSFESFEIELSKDAVNYEKIGMLDAESSTSNYNFEFNKPWNQSRFYRIKANLYNGLSIYSNVVTTFDENIESQLQIFPNPSSGQLFILLTNENNLAGFINIFDMNGKILKKIDIQSNQKLEIDIHDLPNGNYIMRANIEGKVIQKIFSKKH